MNVFRLDPGNRPGSVASCKMQSCTNPRKVSIVVATYNAADVLNRCLATIYEQTYESKEIIVIDGGSDDGTVDILRGQGEGLIWISEPDRGIYDAWNKALSIQTGEWICFLGADDRYAHPNALADMMTLAEDGVNFISARGGLVSERGELLKSFGLMWEFDLQVRRDYICHPGSLHHRSLFEELGCYDIRYRITADYEFLLRAYKVIRARYLDEVVVLIGDKGVSRGDAWTTIIETAQVWSRHPGIGVGQRLVNFLRLSLEYVVWRFLGMLGVENTVRRLLYKGGIVRR